MKTNEAPEKIYLQVCGDCPQTDCDNCKFEDFEDNITWCKDKIFKKDIEYTRTDALIGKAWDWIEDNMLTPNQRDESLLYFEQFKKYIKGE